MHGVCKHHVTDVRCDLAAQFQPGAERHLAARHTRARDGAVRRVARCGPSHVLQSHARWRVVRRRISRCISGNGHAKTNRPGHSDRGD
jgi:hypothetical protein